MYFNSELPTMNDTLEKLEFRYTSLLILPSHNGNYFDTIIDCLTYVNRNTPSVNRFNEWFCNNYSVCIRNGYNSRKILERANLILVSTDNNLCLTTEGKKCFTDDAKKIISYWFLDAFEGMLEILIVLEYINTISKKKLFNIWYKEFSNSFNSSRNNKSYYEQFKILINYLISFNLVNKTNNNELYLNTESTSKIFHLTSHIPI